MPATLSKIQNNVELTLYLKDKTHMTNDELGMISDEGKQKMKECLEGGLPANMVADMFSQGLQKALQDNSMILKGEIEEEINAGNFKEIIHKTGRDSFSYKKVVTVDGMDYSFDQKDFNSERQCRQWIRMKKIHIKF